MARKNTNKTVSQTVEFDAESITAAGKAFAKSAVEAETNNDSAWSQIRTLYVAHQESGMLSEFLEAFTKGWNSVSGRKAKTFSQYVRNLRAAAALGVTVEHDMGVSALQAANQAARAEQTPVTDTEARLEKLLSGMIHSLAERGWPKSRIEAIVKQAYADVAKAPAKQVERRKQAA